MKNYYKHIQQFINIPEAHRIPLTPHFARLAVSVVLKAYPPADADGVFRILSALNLLNAIIKQPQGRQLVSYQFIKGYASLVFTHVARRQTAGVDIYWDARESVAYFRVFGVQISFHHMPITIELSELLPQANRHAQTWDRLRLQTVSAELFLLANPEYATGGPPQILLGGKTAPVSPGSSAFGGCWRCRDRTPPPKGKAGRGLFVCTPHTLQTALTFSFVGHDVIRLYRRKDHRPMTIVRYTGSNYQQLIELLTRNHPAVYHRRKETLRVGNHYYVSPQMHIESVAPSHRLILLSQNAYLLNNNSRHYHNLCVSYGVARYITACYPSVRFINLLNFNRRKVANHYYTHNALRRVPLHSQARRLKVWMIVDRSGSLGSFDVKTLPTALVDDYLQTPDYFKEFELKRKGGLVGIYAYRHHHLLPPVYSHIYIHNYHAQVRRPDGKMAVYSLNDERFKTDFIYDDIWYNQHDFTIYGLSDGNIVVICSLHPEQPFP